MTRDEERSANRAAFPEAARIVDELRSVFGPGVKLLWWKENGQAIGDVPEDETPS
jgi:hypothetical protein